MSNKRITQLPAKTTTIQSGDLFEIAEDQGNNIFVSKKITGASFISSIPIGPQGAQGNVGPAGPAGPTGATGATGPQGPAGTNAVSGITYAGDWNYPDSYSIGDFVTYGNQVYICSTAVGPVSPSEDPTLDTVHWTLLSIQGAQGPMGPQGVDGAVGPMGDVGPQGPMGPQGDIGPQGDVGPAGPQGDVGPAGPVGPMGPVGAASAGSFTHWIGEKYQGGTIAHLWKDSAGVEHGLILCEDKLIWNMGTGVSDYVPWKPQSSSLSPLVNSSMDGAANTTSLISFYGVPSSASENYAAYLCDQLVYGGQSDWYLPSLYEMMAIKQNAFAINSAIIGLGSGDIIDSQGIYWTSTFLPNQQPVTIWGEYYTYASVFITSWNAVRAIRKF